MGFDKEQGTTDHGQLSGLSDDDHAQYLLGQSDNVREEHGQVSHNDPGTATDGTWDTLTNDTQSVTYGTAFGSSPTVVAEAVNVNQGTESINNVSTTGHDMLFFNYRSGASVGPTSNWIAVGDE